MELKLKGFATFADKDENDEKFSYTGQIVALDQKSITLDTGSALMTFPRSEENLFSTAKRPKGWKERAPVEVQPKKTKKVATGATKRELVEKLVLVNPKLTRKEHIDLVVKEIGMTPAGASTYVSYARKLLK
jgi:hypothetical protein